VVWTVWLNKEPL